jgi:AcrR family transcriptional regulator
MPGRQKTNGKRDEILAAAATEFTLRDFHEVLMEDVAARAGVGKGTLYRYFPTKEELLLAIVARGLDDVHVEFLRVFDEDAPLERILETAISRMLSYFSGRAEFLSLLQRYEHRLPKADADAWQQRKTDVLRAIALVLERAERSGGVRQIDTLLAAEMLLGMVRAVILNRPMKRVDRMAREIVSLFLDGVRKNAVQAGRPALRAVRGVRA